MEHRLAGPVNSRKTNVSRIIASVTATARGTSTFVGYKYLEYGALDVGNGNKQIGQQLVGAGIRFDF